MLHKMGRADSKKPRKRSPAAAGDAFIASALRTLEAEGGGVAALAAAMRDGLGAPFVAAVDTDPRGARPRHRHRHGQVGPRRAQDRGDASPRPARRPFSSMPPTRATATSA